MYYESIMKKYENQEILTFLSKTTVPYTKLPCKIISIDKWIVKRKTIDPIDKIFKSRYTLYNYSGSNCLYQKCEHIFGPRLDINIEIGDKEKKFITLNIYDEIMEITGYSKMSFKLSESFQQNEGRETEIYLFENGDISFNVRSLMSLSYGYRGKF